MNRDPRLAPKPTCDLPATLAETLFAPGTQEKNRPTEPRLFELPGYVIVGKLGEGGMGVVYKARQLALDRLVALKMLPAFAQETHRELVRKEALAIARVQHPNIVQVFEVGENEGQAYFSMELLEGGSLEAKIEEKPLDPAEAARLVHIVAGALQAAHQLGLIHCDLKPGNVLLAADGTPKVADFGLARSLDGPSSSTRTGTVRGTPSYMAPEQADGRFRDFGPAVDIYALGALLYELLTGRPPFLAPTMVATLDQVRNQEPVPVRQLQPNVPRDLETICLKCLQKDPHRRYPSAQALAEDLERFLQGRPILARPVSGVEKMWRWCRLHPSVAALLGVSLLALLGFLGGGSWFTLRLNQELEHTKAARAAAQKAEGVLQRALVHQAAGRLDSDLRQLAAIPETIAAYLSRQSQWDETTLETWIKLLIKKEPRIFGICVAFEPRQADGIRDEYALYVFRRDHQQVSNLLLAPEYNPPYRDRIWYSVPKKAKKALWSEPYVDEVGDGTPMVTYSVPIFRLGSFVGIVTADLSMDYFKDLDRLLNDLVPEVEESFYLLTPGNTFLYHPLPQRQFPAPASLLNGSRTDQDFAKLLTELTRTPDITLKALDPESGEQAHILSSPVPSSGWTLVMTVPLDPFQKK